MQIAQSEAPAAQKAIDRQRLDALVELCKIGGVPAAALLAHVRPERPASSCGNCDICLDVPRWLRALRCTWQAAPCCAAVGSHGPLTADVALQVAVC